MNDNQVEVENGWRRIGTAMNGNLEYSVWRREEDGIFQLSNNGAPSPRSGGYTYLDTILGLKGCTSHDVTEDSCTPSVPYF